ncbi:galactosyldiacylglycerol synthase [Cytobacillus suaedae]|nr:galactosyldiacylglycerol synthase [Cytobacillus suaedae]
MKKILVFPLLDSLPSGHHQVANTIMDYVATRSSTIECKKIDILNSWSPTLESVITKSYLQWIQRFPKSYAMVYKILAHQTKQHRSYKHYEIIFSKKLRQIIAEESPDLIICTHAFPSYLVNRLKKIGACDVPVLNIYTDFFMNDVWGKEMIDYHFVSDVWMKGDLMNIYRIPEQKIFVTGIPVDEQFTLSNAKSQHNKQVSILLSGGSAGLGNIKDLFEKVKSDERIKLYVLCGNNQKLFESLLSLNNSNIQPLPYISSRKEMNQLYNMVDAIITKPGGVTVSEAIKKKLPIFIHSALPGQEEINLKHLIDRGIVFMLDQKKNIGDQIIKVLSNQPKVIQNNRLIERYVNSQQLNDPNDIYEFIVSVLDKSGRTSHIATKHELLNKPLQV